jgi:hypothetical protein
MPKQRRKPERWQAIIAEYERSGQSRDEFCKTHKLNREYFGKRQAEDRLVGRDRVLSLV